MMLRLYSFRHHTAALATDIHMSVLVTGTISPQ